jgi:hypothetical protein
VPAARVPVPVVAFLGYVAVSMLMVNTPGRPLLPPPLGGRVQLGDVIFPLPVAPWPLAGLPGLRRVAAPAGVPAAIWVTASAVTATVAVRPGPAWRETAALAYLGLVRPLTGWGPDGWPAISARAHELGIAPPHVRFASAHGEIFGVAAETGVIGLVAFTAFWALVLRAMRPGAAGGFVGTLAHHQVLATVGVLLTSLHLHVMRFQFLWIILALGIAAAVSARQETAA